MVWENVITCIHSWQINQSMKRILHTAGELPVLWLTLLAIKVCRILSCFLEIWWSGTVHARSLRGLVYTYPLHQQWTLQSMSNHRCSLSSKYDMKCGISLSFLFIGNVSNYSRMDLMYLRCFFIIWKHPTCVQQSIYRLKMLRCTGHSTGVLPTLKFRHQVYRVGFVIKQNYMHFDTKT